MIPRALVGPGGGEIGPDGAEVGTGGLTPPTAVLTLTGTVPTTDVSPPRAVVGPSGGIVGPSGGIVGPGPNFTLIAEVPTTVLTLSGGAPSFIAVGATLELLSPNPDEPPTDS